MNMLRTLSKVLNERCGYVFDDPLLLLPSDTIVGNFNIHVRHDCLLKF